MRNEQDAIKEFIHAAKYGSVDDLIRHLDQGLTIQDTLKEWIYGCALGEAAYAGRTEIVKLLLDRGANIHILGGNFGSVLGAAAYSRSTEIVKLLLDLGANINILGGDYGCALGAAAYSGSTEIVKLLLDRGANINILGGIYGSVLGAAVYSGSTEIVELLLGLGANINSVGGDYGCALGVAAHMRKTILVRLLLDRGANVNIAAGKYGSVLSAAAYQGITESVKLLLNLGANIDSVGGDYGCALGAAAYAGHRKIVKLLMDWGASIDIVGGNYGCALGAAAYSGNTRIVKLLLDRGANINSFGGDYGSVLGAAAHAGNTQTVGVLLERGANIYSFGGHYGSVLGAAAHTGNTETVSLLLDRETNIEVFCGHKYGTALGVAIHDGKMEIMNLLLARGANIDIIGGQYGTALCMAVHMRSKEMVDRLLTMGADIHFMALQWGTVLGVAARRQDLEMVELLLDHGADPNYVGGIYSGIFHTTALDAAQQSDPGPAKHKLLTLLANNMRIRNEIILCPQPFPMPSIGPSPSAQFRLSTTSPLDVVSRFYAEFQANVAIRPDQANTLCAKLEEEILIQSLINLVGLGKYEAQRFDRWIRRDVRYFVSQNFDFGLAYAAARIAWKHFGDGDGSISIQRGLWNKHANRLHKDRTSAISKDSRGQELINSPYSIMPRRIWDLKSNRVIDFLMLHSSLHAQSTTPADHPVFWAVTHSWTNDMVPIMTPINNEQWPVPRPKDVSLDGTGPGRGNLRSELLSLGAEYIWVDVLCLRQKTDNAAAGSPEALLQENEWKVDIPTIGNIYRAAHQIVRYFNGLGVEFSVANWDDRRHWLKRAWTLQEITSESTTFNGGIPKGMASNIMDRLGQHAQSPGNVSTLRKLIRPVLQLATQIKTPAGCTMYDLTREMAKRHSAIRVDKVAGLFYLLNATQLPCYHAKVTDEKGWRQSFHLLPLARRIEVLFDFPYRGSQSRWVPTWKQMMEWPKRRSECEHITMPTGSHEDQSGRATQGIRIRDTLVLSQVRLSATDVSSGYNLLVGNMGFPISFYAPYESQQPIEVSTNKKFALATLKVGYEYNWMLGEVLSEQRRYNYNSGNMEKILVLKKIGVLRTDSCNELNVRDTNGWPLVSTVDCLFV